MLMKTRYDSEHVPLTLVSDTWKICPHDVRRTRSKVKFHSVLMSDNASLKARVDDALVFVCATTAAKERIGFKAVMFHTPNIAIV